MTAACETCRFWQMTRELPSGDHGRCRIHAPVRVAGEDDGWPGSWNYDTCGEHQPRAAAPAPEADTGALRAALSECADEMLGTVWLMDHHNYSDVSKQFRDCIARARAALSATPPRPAMDPETRRVLEDTAEGLSSVAEDLNYGWSRQASICEKHVTAIRAHLAAHGGGDE